MCGRFSVLVDYLEAKDQYQARIRFQFRQNYNVSPGHEVPVLLEDGEGYLVDSMRWGLIPHWAREESAGYKMINARGETIHEKPAFRKPFQETRCLILSSGFFEWQKTPDGKKPYFIWVRNRKLFGFAGIWTTWKDKSCKEIHSCSIITTRPNEFVRPIHDRMPVILDASGEKTWLDQDSPQETLLSLLRPYPSHEMEGQKVSTLVNSPRNNTPEILKPAEMKPSLNDFA